MSTNPQNTSDERQQLMERMSYLGQMLSSETAHFHHTAAAKQGFSVTDSKTISVLMQEGPMTAGQLSKRLCLTTGAVTSVIDRLEQCGIVRRAPDPNDRRKVIVRTVPQRIAEASKTYDSIGNAFVKLLSNYSLDELRFLTKYYQAAIELTKEEIINLHK